MNPHDLILLSTYRLPTESALYLGDHEVAAFLNGLVSLWHPAALACAAALPRVSAPYEHDEPGADHLFALTDEPPEGWRDRALAAGAIVFTASEDREQTQRNLLEALRARFSDEERMRPVWAAPADLVATFQAVGFGCAVLSALLEAMQRDNEMPTDELIRDVAAALEAIGDPAACRVHLQSAADRLLAARERAYEVTLHLLDFSLLDEEHLESPSPALTAGLSANLIASAWLLEKLAKDNPEGLASLREKVAAGLAEVLGGGLLEREDPFLPIESQLWNLLRGQAVCRDLIGQDVTVFARKRFGWHPQSPLLLQRCGFTHSLQIPFDESIVPTHYSAVISWPSHDGKQVDCYTRMPLPADSPQTFFHLAHHLHQTIVQDHTAGLALLHRDKPACSWYSDWLELTKLAPVLGTPTTLSKYFGTATSGDYTAAISPDELVGNYLAERTAAGVTTPISAFANWQRGRRNLDAAWTFAAILHSLGGKVEDREGEPFSAWLTGLEDRFERRENSNAEDLVAARDQAGEALAKRLTARGQPNSPGWLVLNPCSFTRRVALELPGLTESLPATGPVKACQVDGEIGRVVVEVPPLGFAWVPKHANGQAPATSRLRMADERCIRNEFLEAEIDLQTGGLKSIRDIKTRMPRFGQQLVLSSGSTMQARSVQATSSGPALAEMVSDGLILDPEGVPVADFRQRFRLWLGRPILEMRIELTPIKMPSGDPWQSYFGARFAWRDEGAMLLRGSTGLTAMSHATRPESPDFVELRIGRQNAVIFPGGLPFHQRHGTRMLDVLLITEGETAQTFELGIGVDRESPPQTALGLTSPVAVVPLPQGPPHVGSTGWLYHLDASNVLLTSLHPRPDGGPGVVATLIECSGHGGPVEFRCARSPIRAVLTDLRDNELFDAELAEDTAKFDVGANDLLRVRVDFA